MKNRQYTKVICVLSIFVIRSKEQLQIFSVRDSLYLTETFPVFMCIVYFCYPQQRTITDFLCTRFFVPYRDLSRIYVYCLFLLSAAKNYYRYSLCLLCTRFFVQGGEDSWDAFSHRSFSAKEPLILGLFY